jgi:hypothetical protein
MVKENLVDKEESFSKKMFKEQAKLFFKQYKHQMKNLES